LERLQEFESAAGWVERWVERWQALGRKAEAMGREELEEDAEPVTINRSCGKCAQVWRVPLDDRERPCPACERRKELELAPSACGDLLCGENHCARCGEHCGAQGHMVGGVVVGRERRFVLFGCRDRESVMRCAPEYLDAIRRDFAGMPWLEQVLEDARQYQRPDRRGPGAANA
ncbi:MAG: hypothetical protein WA208_00800, partial [Thermoanaerobaculia bacterium]